MVYVLGKFQSHLVDTKVTVYTNHAVIWYLFSKKDAKLHIICKILLLKIFDLEVKDQKLSKKK